MNSKKLSDKQLKEINQYLDEGFLEESLAKINDDHSQIGLFLKFHLIIEYYLTENLSHNLVIDDIKNVRLSFHQKVNLISKKDKWTYDLKPALLELNKIRNKFAHNIGHKVKFSDLIEIKEQVKRFRDTEHNSLKKLLIDFTILSLSQMLRSQSRIKKIFE